MAFQIINTTYFDSLLLSLPNTDPLKPQGAVLMEIINELTPEYLKTILGVDMYNDFMYGIRNVTDTIYSADAKWLELLFGKKIPANSSFENDWLGFSNHNVNDSIGNTSRKSPIANYVYYQYVTQRYSTTMGQGEARATHENATNISSYDKLQRAFNKMVELNFTLHNFIMANVEDYPNYIGIQYPPIELSSVVYGTFNNSISNPTLQNDNQNLFVKINQLSI